MNLAVALDPRLAALHGGGRVAGVVRTGAGGAARAVEVWLEFVEQVGEHRHVAARTSAQRLHEGPIPPGHELRFALRLPAGALPTLETEWGALRWALVVRVDRPQRPELRAELELEVRA